MGSGVILREVIEAASILEKDFNVSSTIFSVTSFTEVRRNALDIPKMEYA
jgi:pyruvate dehydrogenase E1 component